MNKVLKYILFRTTLIIVILHTFISHPHSGELTKNEHIEFHKKSNSLFSIIRLVFHENNDENLDNLIFAEYDNVKNLNKKVKQYKTNFLNSLKINVNNKTYYIVVNFVTNNFNKIVSVKFNGLRAPPFLFEF